jgi:3-oxoacyl-[acyl-carrier-protein] synthase II
MLPNSKRVVVTGMGLVSPAGHDLHTFWDNVVHGRSCIGFLPDEYRRYMQAELAAFCTADLGQWLPPSLGATLDRVSQLALCASIIAMKDASLTLSRPDAQRTGVYLGTGAGGVATSERSIVAAHLTPDQRSRPLTIVMGMQNAAAAQIGLHHGVLGPTLTYSTACSSSSVAIGEAFRAIQSGRLNSALAGGAEAPLTMSMMKAWDAMGALAKTDARVPIESAKPFSADRTGFVMGEGAAILVLEDMDSALRRGAVIHGELLGYATGNDCFHIAKPHVEGEIRAMKAALDDAGLRPQDIAYINAHGTATQAGDAAEAEAIHDVFVDAGRQVPVAVSSTKAVHGHLIGAAGAIELIATLLAMQHETVPPTAHMAVPDMNLKIDVVPNVARSMKILHAMSNSFAFGGSNAVLIAGKLN